MEAVSLRGAPAEPSRADSQIRAFPGPASRPALFRPRARRSSVVCMTNEPTIEPTAHELVRLFGEIRRYLAAVEEFRRLGCEPRWRSEAVRS